LVYDDASGAIRWLVAAFGFTETVRVPGPAGTILHAELCLGDGTVMVESAPRPPAGPAPGRVQSSEPRAEPDLHPSVPAVMPDLGLRSPRTLGGVSHGVCLSVDDPGAALAIAEAAGARLVRPLRDTDHGQEFSVFDLEGHLWTIGSYRPGSTATNGQR
jgi:uncharacterized glyoxalase superfamily protein PhnB